MHRETVGRRARAQLDAPERQRTSLTTSTNVTPPLSLSGSHGHKRLVCLKVGIARDPHNITS